MDCTHAKSKFHFKYIHKTEIAVSLPKTGVAYSRLVRVIILVGNLWILEKSLNRSPPSLQVHYWDTTKHNLQLLCLHAHPLESVHTGLITPQDLLNFLVPFRLPALLKARRFPLHIVAECKVPTR
jgi:hypothetical protein